MCDRNNCFSYFRPLKKRRLMPQNPVIIINEEKRTAKTKLVNVSANKKVHSAIILKPESGINRYLCSHCSNIHNEVTCESQNRKNSQNSESVSSQNHLNENESNKIYQNLERRLNSCTFKTLEDFQSVHIARDISIEESESLEKIRNNFLQSNSFPGYTNINKKVNEPDSNILEKDCFFEKINDCNSNILAERDEEGSLQNIFEYVVKNEFKELDCASTATTEVLLIEAKLDQDENLLGNSKLLDESKIRSHNNKMSETLSQSLKSNKIHNCKNKILKQQLSITNFFQPLTRTVVSKKEKLHSDSFTDNTKNNIMLNITSKQFYQKSSKVDLKFEISKSHRICPFYKKIPDTKFSVDAFSYGSIPDIEIYFLSHFHSDHYQGLTQHFKHPLYCSKITANLIISKLHISAAIIHALPLEEPIPVQNCLVTLIEANHCPGAVMFFFQLNNGKTVLHTGDFRAADNLRENWCLINKSIDILYLDTTYCDPRYNFPSQNEVINFTKELVFKILHNQPKTLIVCGSYCIGKEKMFVAIAEQLQSQVFVSAEKRKTLKCLEDDQITNLLTTEKHMAQVHVLSMQCITIQKLKTYLEEFRNNYDHILGIKPTGWTFSKKSSNLYNIQPQVSGPVTIYGVPYSEHSSFHELESFVKFMKPKKIFPIVNNGSRSKREKMQNYFTQWLSK